MVRVEEKKWHNTRPYTVKLEAARHVGYQTISMVIWRYGHYSSHIDEWLTTLEASFTRKANARQLEDVQLEIRINGHSETLGALKPLQAMAARQG